MAEGSKKCDDTDDIKTQLSNFKNVVVEQFKNQTTVILDILKNQREQRDKINKLSKEDNNEEDDVDDQNQQTDQNDEQKMKDKINWRSHCGPDHESKQACRRYKNKHWYQPYRGGRYGDTRGGGRGGRGEGNRRYGNY